MAELPWSLDCYVLGPNRETFILDFWSYDTGLRMKERFSEKSGYSAEDLKILFGEHEMIDTEKLEDLVPLGFIEESELFVELINPLTIVVHSDDGKEFPVLVTPKCRLECVANAVCNPLNLRGGLGEIAVRGSKCDQYRTIDEMDIDEKTVLKFHLCPLADLILKKDSLTPSIIELAISYVEKVPFPQLKRNITKEFLCEIMKLMKSNEKNKEIRRNLKSLIVEIAYRGCITVSPDDYNSFYSLFDDSKLLSLIKREGKGILNGEEGYSWMEEKEREETVLCYGLIMKYCLIDECLLVKLFDYLMERIKKERMEGKRGTNEMKLSLALRGVCENYCFILFFYFLVSQFI
jgi:hypothetical protein